MHPQSPTIVAMLNEGVFDPHILKAIFMAGGGGSGKTFIAKMMFGGMGLKFANSDSVLERMAKALDLDLSDPDVMSSPMMQNPTFGVRVRAQRLAGKRLDLWLAGRLGLVIDSTASKTTRVFTTKRRLEKEFGYDTMMVFVNTSLETALERNRNRTRRVPEEVVKKDWENVQKARDLYDRAFGKHFVEIRNDEHISPRKMVAEVQPRLTRIAMKFLNRPISNPVGRLWLKQHAGDDDEETVPLAASLAG